MERQQIKWFAYAAGLTAITTFLRISTEVVDTPVWFERAEFAVFTAAGTAIPIAIGIAILRYRLYDIDLIINRTLVYGTLTVVLAVTYFGGVIGLQYVFRTFTGQGSQLAIVASTLAIAALFNPLRRWVQAFVDRRFYRRKYNAAKTLAAFNARLRDETELDTLSGEVVGVVRDTMQPAHVSLWLRSDTPAKDSPAD